MNKIQFARPDLGISEIKEVCSVLESGWLTSGPKTREFEAKVGEMTGAKEVVAVDSCTTALEFSLRLLGIGPGDDVITTPLTYTATADVIHAIGAKIVFADTDGSSFEMDYEDVERKVTEKTKAIIAVDYGGKVCDYDRIIEISDERKKLFVPNNDRQEELGRIAVIADAAHSFGASRGTGQRAGEYADITCFSFHVLKNITTGGEGGAVCLKEENSSLAEELRGMRHHHQTGKDPENGWEYDIKGMGFNRPMTDVDAAIGLAQLKRLESLKERRAQITRFYNTQVNMIDGVRPLLNHIDGGGESAYHLFPIEVVDKSHEPSEEFRNRVIIEMKKIGVPCNVHYKPLPMFTAYKNLGFRIGDYPNAYRTYSSMLSLPYHTLLTMDQLYYIVRGLKEVMRK